MALVLLFEGLDLLVRAITKPRSLVTKNKQSANLDISILTAAALSGIAS